MILWYSVTLTAAYIFRLWSFFCGNASQRAGGGGGGAICCLFVRTLNPVYNKIQSKVSICSYVTSILRTLFQLSPLKA